MDSAKTKTPPPLTRERRFVKQAAIGAYFAMTRAISNTLLE